LPISRVVAAHNEVGFVVKEQAVDGTLDVERLEPGLARLPMLQVQ
jgi:hypothetical protein